MMGIPGLVIFQKLYIFLFVRSPQVGYSEPMARGWESKSVEAQQEDAAKGQSSTKPRLSREEANFSRDAESLRLTLKRIVEQLQNAQNPRHRQMLEQARLDLQQKMEELERLRSAGRTS
jgi:hypothetical protein